MKNVGMIGLGIMGEPMARNLANAGFNLSVWNRTLDKANTLVDDGAHFCPTASDLAEHVETVVIMVSGPDDLLEIVYKITSVSLREKIIINVSTVSPEASIDAERRIKEAGGRFLDAPVSGSKVPAIQGSLVFLVGGDEELLEESKDILEAMGSKIVHCGPVGAGSRMKLAVNLLLTNFIQGLAETMLFIEKMGLSTIDFLEVATCGAMAAPMVKLKGDAIVAGNFSAHFPLRHLSKDMGLVLDEATRCNASLPIGTNLGHILKEAVNQDIGDDDICALYKALKNRGFLDGLTLPFPTTPSVFPTPQETFWTTSSRS